MRNLMRLLLTFCLICAAPGRSTAVSPVYTTVLVSTSQPVSVDGDLSDWTDVGAPVQSLTTWMRSGLSRGNPFGVGKFFGPQDLSANFRAFADQAYLYVAVDVTDDQIVFEREALDEFWWDDAVQIYLDGDLANPGESYDANDSLIEITRSPDGDLVLGGQVYQQGARVQVPYLWESVGVQAALREREGGYTVEVRIPRDILGSNAFGKNTKIGLNVVVCDEDGEGRRENKLGWSEDVDSRGHITTKKIGHLLFGSEKPGPSSGAKDASGRLKAKVQEGDKGDLVVTLTGQSSLNRRISFDDFQNSTLEAAQRRFKQIKTEAPGSKGEIWSAAVVCVLAMREGQAREAMRALDAVNQADSTSYIANWSALKRRTLEASLNGVTGQAQDPVAQWEQVRQYAERASNGRLVRRAFEAMVRLYDKQDDQSSADDLRREAIDFCNGLIQQDSIQYQIMRAAQTRLAYRLQLGETVAGGQEVKRDVEAFAGQPRAAYIFYGAANAYRAAGMYEQAILACNQMLTLDLDDYTTALAQYGLGKTYFRMGNYSEAIRQYEAVLRDYGTREDPFIRNILLNSSLGLAHAYRESGNSDRETEYLNRVMTYNPSPPSAKRPSKHVRSR